MKLVINTPGSYISKSGECFLVSCEEKKTEISVKKVEQILITTAAAISTDAILLAVENNVDIVFLKYNGQPYGRVWHSKLGSISTIRRKQLSLQENEYGLGLVKEAEILLRTVLIVCSTILMVFYTDKLKEHVYWQG